MSPEQDPAAGEPGALVERYLDFCQKRELDAAAALLAPDPTIVFPGDVRYPTLDAMVEDARTRYRWIAKRPDRALVAACQDGSALVVSMGTLYGEALGGAPFEGVRYVDVFVVRDGRIAEQHVYNDLAQSGVVGPSRPAAGHVETH